MSRSLYWTNASKASSGSSFILGLDRPRFVPLPFFAVAKGAAGPEKRLIPRRIAMLATPCSPGMPPLDPRMAGTDLRNQRDELNDLLSQQIDNAGALTRHLPAGRGCARGRRKLLERAVAVHLGDLGFFRLLSERRPSCAAPWKVGRSAIVTIDEEAGLDATGRDPGRRARRLVATVQDAVATAAYRVRMPAHHRPGPFRSGTSGPRSRPASAGSSGRAP